MESMYSDSLFKLEHSSRHWSGVFKEFISEEPSDYNVSLINQKARITNSFFSSKTEFPTVNVRIPNAIFSPDIELKLDCHDISHSNSVQIGFFYKNLSLIQTCNETSEMIIEASSNNQTIFVMLDHPSFNKPNYVNSIFGFASALNANSSKDLNHKIVLAGKNGAILTLNYSEVIQNIKGNSEFAGSLAIIMIDLLKDMLLDLLENSGITNLMFIKHWWYSLLNAMNEIALNFGMRSLSSYSNDVVWSVQSAEKVILTHFKKAVALTSEDAVEDYTSEAQEIIESYESYSTDLVKMMEHPHMINLMNEDVKSLDRIISKVKLRLINNKIISEDFYLDLKQTYDTALRFSETNKLSMFDNSQKQKIQDARTALNLVYDESSPANEKKSGIKVIKSKLEGVLPINDKVMEHIYQTAGLRELEG